jgi:periplasmic divalent cation tolerance protein
MSNELVVLVTAPHNEAASSIAETVVAEHLAACVNIISGMQSVYWWEGKLNRDNEVLLIIKTTDDHYQNLEQRIRALHSYTTPEVIALRIDRGLPAYLEWLRQAVGDTSS